MASQVSTMNLSLNSTFQSTFINDTDLGPKADKQVCEVSLLLIKEGREIFPFHSLRLTRSAANRSSIITLASLL